MAEWRVQPRFTKWLILFAFLGLASDGRSEWPDRRPGPERLVALRYDAVHLNAGEGVTISGAWDLSAADPRFAGLSGLAVDRGGLLLAVTDSGVLIDLPKPGLRPLARLRDLVGGPGPATFKKYRDAEGLLLLRDRRIRGEAMLAISFEHRHMLFTYTREGRQLSGEPLPAGGWPANKGAEAIVADGAGNLLLLGEEGRDVLVRTRGRVVRQELSGASGAVADAVRLPDGRIVVAVREVGPLGLTNRLAWLERSDGGYRLRNFATLPLGPLDNVEGLAAEADAERRTVLWAVTDNDGWRRTLLLRMELRTKKTPAEAGA